MKGGLNYTKSPKSVMVGRVGFEPTNPQGGQIYSLLILTAHPPADCRASRIGPYVVWHSDLFWASPPLQVSRSNLYWAARFRSNRLAFFDHSRPLSGGIQITKRDTTPLAVPLCVAYRLQHPLSIPHHEQSGRSFSYIAAPSSPCPPSRHAWPVETPSTA